MPELIERGHIYIAQPPLYKIKKGKQERYVKDDAELNEYLIQMALEKTQLITNNETPEIKGIGLEKLANEYLGVEEVISRMGRRYDNDFLEQLSYESVLTKEAQQDETQLTTWLSIVEKGLNQRISKSTFTMELAFRSAEDYTLTIHKKSMA